MFQVSRGLATTMYKHHTQTRVKVQRQTYNPWVITGNHTPKGLLIHCGFSPWTRCQYLRIRLKQGMSTAFTQAFTELWVTHSMSYLSIEVSRTAKQIPIDHYLPHYFYVVAGIPLCLLATLKLR